MDFGGFVKMVLQNQTADSTNQFRLLWKSRNENSFLRSWANQVKLPTQIYSSENLHVLKLGGPVSINLPSRVYLPNLAVLELESVRYESDKSFVKLLSGCPVLESFAIKRTSKSDNLVVCSISSLTLKRLQICFDFEYDFHGTCANWSFNEEERTPVVMSLIINAPALECLDFNDTVSEKVSVQGLTSVREVKLEKVSYCAENMVVELVQALSRVKFMKLGISVMQNLSVAPNKLCGCFERLTRLVVTCCPSRHWGCLVELMDCCVKLEVMKIVISENEYEEEYDEDEPDEDGSDVDVSCSKLASWKDPVRVPTCLSSSLRQVTIRGFTDDMGMIAMLKFILDKGLVLERVNLWFLDNGEDIDYEELGYDAERIAFEERERGFCDNAPVDYEERYRLLKKILMLSRASPACQVQDLSVS